MDYRDFATSRMKKKHVKRSPSDLDLMLQMSSFVLILAIITPQIKSF